MARMRYKKRPDGRYEAKVYLGMVDGKKKYKAVYGATQKEVQAKADAVRLQLGKGLDVSADGDTFQLWADRWAETKRQACTPAQAASYEAHIQRYTDVLGARPIARIKLHELQAVLDQLAKENPYTHKPTGKRTLCYFAAAAKQVFDYAIANRAMEYNPAKGLQVPRDAPKTERRALARQERQWVLSTPHMMQPAAMIMMLAGLRRGEVTALQWSDVDLKRNTITVRQSYDFKNNRLKSPKTAAGWRTVFIPDNLSEYLAGLPRAALWVFPGAHGGMALEGEWERGWLRYLDELNRVHGDFGGIKVMEGQPLPFVIERFTPHCLRHTYCTMLYESGIDVVTAKALMGHKDIKTTLGIYTHLSKEKAEHDVTKLNEFLGRGMELCSSEDRQEVG